MNIKRVSIWVVTNVAMIWCMYSGVFNNAVWAANILKFMLWVNLIMIMFLFIAASIDPELKNKCVTKGTSVPVSVNIVYDLLFSIALASAGWFGYATINIIAGLVQMNIFTDTTKEDK